ncbi:hypothetical protein [Paenibacillus ihbetae]|uniref:Uncharacterized protein n=1 Tax=Paenibacillus ihbetae TaxID=1870820 RepID=A0ABX3JS29_9BACL|nr:hypothetical protein [Paenibacillus ihbetae]OOC58730.1 hypothetical protein BBD40_23920 [Paenibacillus ihbetae]
MARAKEILEPSFDKTWELIYKLASKRISQKYDEWKKSRNFNNVYRVSTVEPRLRAAEDLPPEEAAIAVRSILSFLISLHDELVKQVVKALGYARSGSTLEKSIRLGHKATEVNLT